MQVYIWIKRDWNALWSHMSLIMSNQNYHKAQSGQLEWIIIVVDPVSPLFVAGFPWNPCYHSHSRLIACAGLWCGMRPAGSSDLWWSLGFGMQPMQLINHFDFATYSFSKPQMVSNLSKLKLHSHHIFSSFDRAWDMVKPCPSGSTKARKLLAWRVGCNGEPFWGSQTLVDGWLH